MEHNKKGTATNNEGLGSTYTGTQSPDPNAPDGYQKPTTEQQESDNDDQPESNHDLGDEYETPSSYGDKQDDDASKKPSSEDDIAEGTPIR